MRNVSTAIALLMAPVMAAAAPAQIESSPASGVSFLEAAKAVTEQIQKDHWNEKAGLYWSKPGGGDHEFMWGNGIMFSALVAASRHEPRACRPIMSRFFDGMNRYWDTKVPIPGYEPAPTRGGGNDKYYDDNAWMVITFVEAYELTGDRKYLRRAKESLDFVLSGWDDVLGGGIYWHQPNRGGKNTCSNAPTAVGALLLARHLDREENLEWAKRITAWTTENLQDEDELFFDSKKVDGRIDKGKLTYNTALMLRANLGLYRATGDEAYLEEAKRIGAACDWFLNDRGDAYRDPPKWSHLQVEADLELYRATGDEAALARARRNGETMFARWQEAPPKDFIDKASVARTLWLLADHETEVGRKFWAESDKLGAALNGRAARR